MNFKTTKEIKRELREIKQKYFGILITRIITPKFKINLQILDNLILK